MPGFGYDIFRYNPLFSGVAVDADAQAFITAASITDPTQQSAVNQLVVDLKAASIWTKMSAVYPFVGGSATTHKFNLKDPRDLDAAFRLNFQGGWTHSSTGALPNGTNAFAITYLDLSANLGSAKPHLSYYSRTNTTTGTDQIDIGLRDGNTPKRHSWLSARYNGSGFDNVLGRNNSASVLLDGGTTTDSRGLYQINKVGTTSKLQRNSTILDTETDTESNPTFYGVNIGAWNDGGGGALYSNTLFFSDNRNLPL